jgi:hypothetical protein
MTLTREIHFYDAPRTVYALTDDSGALAPVAYSWSRCPSQKDWIGTKAEPDPEHRHSIECLWVWHDCDGLYGPRTADEFRGQRVGWGPAGVGAHTLVHRDPLTITASVYWPDCCGLHGFITDGRWLGV